MMRALKLVLSLVAIAGLVYLGFFVPFGKKTIYEHVVGISRTREARKLGREVEKKYEKTRQRIGEKIQTGVSDLKDETHKAQDALLQSAAEKKKAIEKAIDERRPTEHTQADQNALDALFQKKIREIGADSRD